MRDAHGLEPMARHGKPARPLGNDDPRVGRQRGEPARRVTVTVGQHDRRDVFRCMFDRRKERAD